VASAQEQPSPQDDIACARELLAKGELAQAAQHVGRALASDPTNAVWRTLLDRIIGQSEDPLQLAPVDEAKKSISPDTAAVRAYILALLGKVAEAVNLIVRVAGLRPEVPYLDWASDWLERDAGAAAQIDRKGLSAAAAAIVQHGRGVKEDIPAIKRRFATLRRFLDRVAGDPDPDPIVAAARVVAAAKLGDFDRAMVLANRAYKSHPGYPVAAAVAGLYRAKGDETNWLKWQQRALKHDPENVPTRVDLADVHFERGEIADAARWYQEALDREPENTWAEPSLYAARYRLGEGEGWLAKLLRYVHEHPKNSRARTLLTPLLPPQDHYITHLPLPTDKTLDTLRNLLEQSAKNPQSVPAGTVSVTLPHLDSPSARLACRLGLEAARLEVKLDITVASIQQPDPRQPRREVERQIWTYPEKRLLLIKQTSVDAVPTVTQSSPSIARRVGELAERSYDRGKWFAWAGELAKLFGPKRLDDVMGAMAFPPRPPRGKDAAEWVYRVQVAAALVIAQLDRNIRWDESNRKRILLDLALGPLDWTVNAAIIALTALAQEERGIVEDIKTVFFDELLQIRPTPGYVCYLHPLVCCGQQLPGITPEERETLIEWQRELEKAPAASPKPPAQQRDS